MTKSELRRSFLAKRQVMTPAQRETASAHVVANFWRYFDIKGINFLHCFIPIERFGEVDTRPIFQRVWSKYPQIQTVIPRVDHEKKRLDALPFGPDVKLVRIRWQIGEPPHGTCVEPNSIDIVLVPLLCFDRTGHRVGYGKGFYDGFLRRCRSDCRKVGLSMFEPIDEITEADENDVTLDFCVTPKGIFDFRN